MARNQTRIFARMMQLIGIVDGINGPKISDDIQMTYLADDLRHLIEPIPPLVFYWDETSAADATRRGIISLQAVGSSIKMLSATNRDGANPILMSIADVNTINLNEAQHAADFSSTGALTRAFLRDGNGTQPGAAVIEMDPDEEFNSAGGIFPVIVPQGRIIQFVTAANNVACDMRLCWQEIPVP